MCTRTLPFEATDPAHAARFILKEAVQSPKSRAPGLDIPEGLDALIVKCLSKKPEERPTTMASMGEALAALKIPKPEPPSDYVKEVMGHARTHFFSDGLSTSPIPVMTSSQASGEAPGQPKGENASGIPPTIAQHMELPPERTQEQSGATFSSGESVFATSPRLSESGTLDGALGDDLAASPFEGGMEPELSPDAATQIKDLPPELVDELQTAADGPVADEGTSATADLPTEVPGSTQVESGPGQKTKK
jgi:serine/threonine protein kinase